MSFCSARLPRDSSKGGAWPILPESDRPVAHVTKASPVPGRGRGQSPKALLPLLDSRQKTGRRAPHGRDRMAARPLLSLPHAAMKRLIGLLIATTLVIGSGCAKQDWIDRTLVTVDVTGTWSGSTGGSASSPGDLLFELKQHGEKVKGSVLFGRGGYIPLGGAGPEPLTGTVSGDVFRFSAARGAIDGELKVSEDEMHGLVSFVGNRAISLRRVTPSSPPASPPR